MLGEYDRQMVSRTRPNTLPGEIFIGAMLSNGRRQPQKPTTTISAQRTRVLSPGEIAKIPAGKALHLDGVQSKLLSLTPAHQTEPWRTLTATGR